MNNGIINSAYTNPGYENADIKGCFSSPSGGLPSPVPMPYYVSTYNNVFNLDNNKLILVFDTKLSAGTTITLNFQSVGTFTVDWGDGNIVTIVLSVVGSRSYTYKSHGIYTVQVYTPSYPQIFQSTGYGPKLIKLLSFGNMNTSNMFNAFPNNTNLIEVPREIPTTSNLTLSSLFNGCIRLNDSNISFWNTSNVISMSSLFASCVAFNRNLGNWNTSNVTSMVSMFQGATNFNNENNSSMSSWDVSKVTNFSNMFLGATSFNSDLSGWQLVASGVNCTTMFQSATNFTGVGLDSWNTSGVTNMATMFQAARAFNQNLSSWDVSKVTTFNGMFRDTLFNNASSSGINNWNTSSATNFTQMLYSCPFNQPISNWNMSSATSIAQMFANNFAFNQDIGNWNISNVTAMNETFGTARGFNNGGSSSISGWNTSNVITMGSMFQNTNVFNQPIGSWNTSKVTNMASMFTNASVFNQDISNWDVSKVTNMINMFSDARAFNQPLTNWNLAGLNANTSLDNFMLNKTGANVYSTANYDALLIGWNNNKLAAANGVANWRTDLRPNFGGAKYTAGGAAATARAALVSYGWTITDGGSV